MKLHYDIFLSGICAPYYPPLVSKAKAEANDEEKKIKEYAKRKQHSGVNYEIDGTLEMDSFFEQVKSIKPEEAKKVYFFEEKKPNQKFVYAGFTDGYNPIGNIVVAKIKYLSNDMQLLFDEGGVRELKDEIGIPYVCYPEVIIEKVEILYDPAAYVKHLKELCQNGMFKLCML